MAAASMRPYSKKRFFFLGRVWITIVFAIGIYTGRASYLLFGSLERTPDNFGPSISTSTSRRSVDRNMRSSSILPRRILAVFGTESSGSTFLATALGIAAGAFPVNGTHRRLPSDRHGNPGRMIVERVVAKRARGNDDRSDVEVQHLSLPWGMWDNPRFNCDPRYASRTEVVEALVPEECFRFENEQFWPSRLNETAPRGCAEEAKIPKSNSVTSLPWTCGGKCGLKGYALYPRRFFVNISSHIEWYLSRGVDITAILAVRDQSISHAGKMKVHCKDEKVALREEAQARKIMKETLERYGERNRGRLGGDNADRSSINERDQGKEGPVRVITVSYEGLMALGQPYLFDVYKHLGIASDYVPEFKDGNAKYVGAATITKT